MKRRWHLRVAGLAALLPLLSFPTTSAATTPTFATLQLAHTAETVVDLKCHPLPGVVDLQQQAAKYQSMGIRGVTETLITSWAHQSTETCVATSYGGHPDDVASWDQIAALQSTYGWTFVSGSRTYTNLNAVSSKQAYTEICGSLADIRSHGLVGAQGEFAYPNDFTSPSLESMVLSCHYDFGRIYTAGPNLQMPLPIAKPYWLRTYSVDGGACNNPSLSCYKLPTRFRYNDPANLAAVLRLDAGRWKVIQGYNFVTGAQRSSSVSWDCTSSDWRNHWTSGFDATEIYCWSDWLAALSSARGLDWVTPAAMSAQRQP